MVGARPPCTDGECRKRVSLVLWVLWICLFHSLFFWRGVGQVFLGFEVLEIANAMKSSHPFFWANNRISWNRNGLVFFCFVVTSDILILFFIFSWNQLQVQPLWAILMLRMPSISLPSLPSFRRWHVLLLMGLMATTMLQGCGCVDTRLQTNKKKPDAGIGIKHRTRWWFQIFFMFTPIWGRFPFWLIFFKGVETTN